MSGTKKDTSMPQAPRPHDENERVRSLHQLNLLDTPLEHKFECITRMVCMLLDVPISAFSLIDAERQWFKSVQGLHATENTLTESMCAYTILEDEVMVVPDAKLDPRFGDNAMVNGQNDDITFYAGCPVRAPDGRKIGTLCAVDRKPRQMSGEQIQLLRDLAHMIESEIKLTQLEDVEAKLRGELDKANTLSLIDPLTRLWNRNGVEDVLRRKWAEAIRRDHSIAFVICDIDNCRKINEAHGHSVGDAVLQEIAKRLLLGLRTEDELGRIGEDKFLLVLPNCPIEYLFDTVERLRLGAILKPVSTSSGEINVTLSFGGTSGVPTSLSQSTQLMRVAEEALLKAKHAGRNQTQLSNAGNIDLIPSRLN